MSGTQKKATSQTSKKPTSTTKKATSQTAKKQTTQTGKKQTTQATKNARKQTAQTAKTTTEQNVLERLLTSEPEEWTKEAYFQGHELRNVGPIDSITLPQDWKQGVALYNQYGLSACEEYRPVNEPEVRFLFFYRGVPIEAADGTNFAAILAAPPHQLMGDELEQIKPLLRGKENSAEFEMMDVRTEDLNGKRVLSLTGIYNEDQKPMLALYINAGRDGSIVQEIEYQAPLMKYPEYLMPVQQTIHSIRWK